MRKFTPWISAVLVCTFATAMSAANYRGQNPKISRSDNGLTAPSSAAASEVVKGYLKDKRTVSAKKEFSGKNGNKHVQMEQSIAGLPVYGAYVKASVDSNGRLVSLIDNAMVILDISQNYNQIVMGAAIVIAVAIEQLKRRYLNT